MNSYMCAYLKFCKTQTFFTYVYLIVCCGNSKKYFYQMNTSNNDVSEKMKGYFNKKVVECSFYHNTDWLLKITVILKFGENLQQCRSATL